MASNLSRRARLSSLIGVSALLALGLSCTPGSRAAAPAPQAGKRAARRTTLTNTGAPIPLTAQQMSTTLPDGTTVPMWGYCASGACTTAWAPGPTIVASAGQSLSIALTNALPAGVPTSLVVLGQFGGGLGAPVTMAGPAHTGQANTTFVGNGPAPAPFTPPAQGPRVRSFGTEAPPATTAGPGAPVTLTWTNLQPGTYLYETGTMPSLQVPMGLYGVLVVTSAPVTATTGTCSVTTATACTTAAQCPTGEACNTTSSFTPGTAYPGVGYDDEVALLLSEIDPVQNAAVAAAAAAGTDPNFRNDPACAVAVPSTCRAAYPAAVDYAPTYFLINGRSFDKTAPQASAYDLADAAPYSTGNLLVRLLNAGSRTHIPAIVGLPMSLVAEDGNPAPGRPKLQDEVLLTAGKTVDVLVRPVAAGASYAPGTFAVFDRQLSLSAGNRPDGGMQGFLLVDHAAAQTTTLATGTCLDSTGTAVACTTATAAAVCAAGVSCALSVVPVAGAPGNLPGSVAIAANPDAYLVPYNTAFSANVTANDIGVGSVALGTGPAHGTLAGGLVNPDGTFTYTPAAGYTGPDQFTYVANGNPALTATVTLSVAAAGVGAAPAAANDAYTSNLASSFSMPRPGVLANDTDPSGYPLTAGPATPGSGCGAVTLNPDGSFDLTAAPGATACVFTYADTNSQGTASNTATVTVSFGAAAGASGFKVSLVDAVTGAALPDDYRWTLQEDLTFDTKATATPSLSTRTVGTSFHRSHMPVLATGCVGPLSCGSGQQVRGVAVPPRPATPPTDVVLDPTKNYFLTVLPGDAANPVAAPPATGHLMGGAQVRRLAGGAWPAVTVKLQSSPIPTAQMSIYIYEDSFPTNGADEPEEPPLGGFNVILFDPAGRTGDPAGQQTYDAFNMPLSNALLGRPGCPDDLNAATNGSGTSASGNLVGAVYTCPNDPNAGTPAADPAKYALAGHALIKNLTPARYDVLAHPGAAREGAGEVWWQTETLEGTAAQDAFVGINEPVYFQEFGPPGPHTTIGFVNPAHVAAYAASRGLTGTASITGTVTNQHMSRPSNVTLWDSGSFQMLSATTCRVVVNSQGGTGPAVGAAECDPNGNFTVTGIAPGTYDVAVFDQWLDQIIQNVAVTVPPNTPVVAMGNLPELSWFTQYDQNIYMDLNGNGVRDPGEPGISNVPLTVRFRNGAPSNVTLSDSTGNGILSELFPLFNWYVAEADTTRFKQTGVSVVVDGGGKPDTAPRPPFPDGTNLWTSSYATGQSSERIERPGALSYGLQGFISQRNRVDWGRTPYVPNENGGIVGTVVLASTRPFDDQRFNVQNIWEPLVPRVTVNLYRRVTLADGTSSLQLVDTTQTSSFDDYANTVSGADGGQYLMGSDYNDQPVPPALMTGLRYPAGAVVGGVAVGGTPAPQGAYPAGKQVNLQCPGQLPGTTAPPPWDYTKVDPFTNYTLGNDQGRCYDGWHNWNQVQAAPYDGRYVFPSPAYAAAHPLPACTLADQTKCPTLVSLPPATYVVEAVTPPGYEVVKEEDKDILIGDAFVAPVTQQFGALASIFILPDQATIGAGQYAANPYNPGTGDAGFQSDPTSSLGVGQTSNNATFPPCVGNLHRVPDYLSLFPQAQQVAPFAGMDRPLCDRKQVVLNDQMQSSANFFVYTEAPVASNNTGIILDDASSEFNGVSPDFGEKATVPFVPVSIKDYTGLEIGRTLSDQWGAYNMMTPSSWLVNPPTPSGYGPNMLVTCINDPGPIPDPAGALDPLTGKVRLITDPAFNPFYSNFCYTNPYMPGQTTYLDTPVLPVAAFAQGYNPADCAPPDQAPAILRVDGSGVGPWLPASGGTLTITAQGDQQVLNPAYNGPFATTGLGSQRTITRHYGFGAAKGRLSIGAVDLSAATTWSDGTLTVAVPAGTPTGELSITTATGQSSVDTVTVNVGGATPTYVTAAGAAAGLTIQAAIDAASPGDLIMVDAGTYNELVIMWKPVRLQGVGAGSVVINAAKYPNSKLEAWRPRINGLFNIDPVSGNQIGPAQVDPLPGQEITGGVVVLEPSVLGSEEGAGVTVLAKNLPASACGDPTRVGSQSNFLCAPSRIDGISVTGGDAGGGIYVNGWAHGLEIANNRVYGNAGAYNGGIRVGVPYLGTAALPVAPDGTILGLGYDVNVAIHHNSVTRNGTVEAPAGGGGAGGGISICSGSDGYRVDHNYVCGNYSSSDGGGIGHLGFSQDGVIASNQILFNQSFQQSGPTHGGGLFVGGEPAVTGSVSLGAGNVTVDSNLIRGNLAEGGQGGGVRLQQANGADVTANGSLRTAWHRVTLSNNVIVDNVSGWAGGGVSLADTLNAAIVDNTIASNDSTGIAGVVLAGGVALPGPTTGVAGVGTPSPAGLVSEPTSTALLGQLATPALRTANAVSQPILANDILWQNRSFYYSGDGRICAGNNAATATTAACTVLPDQSATGQCVAGATYWDLGVLGDTSPAPGPVRLAPRSSEITSIAGYQGAQNTAANPNLAAQYCNGSRVAPELPGVLNPYSVKNMQVAATLDEGNNYVNLKYGPLYGANPVTGAAFGGYARTDALVPGSLDLAASLNHTATGQATFLNTGAAALRITGITLGGANAGQFSQINDCPASLAAGASCTLTVTFAPTAPNPVVKSAFVTVAVAAPGTSATLALTGTVLAPNLTFTPDPALFGTLLRVTSAPQTITVTNVGPGIAVLNGPPALTGANPLQFAQTNNCPATLAVGASCTATVTFTPTSATPITKSALLTFRLAAPGTIQSGTLTGTVLVPAINLNPTTIAFGTQTVGTTTPQDVALLNTGTGTLTITGFRFAGPNAAQFSQTNNCPATLAAGATCTIIVNFHPTSRGAKSATLTVSGTAPAMTGTVSLTGTGL